MVNSGAFIHEETTVRIVDTTWCSANVGTTTRSGSVSSGYTVFSHSAYASSSLNTYLYRAEGTFACLSGAPLKFNLIDSGTISSLIYTETISSNTGKIALNPFPGIYVPRGDQIIMSATCTASGDISGMAWSARIVLGGEDGFNL